MIRRVVLLLFAPLLCAAAESCPWINPGTAGGILGGTVDSKVTQTSCEFTRHDDKTFATLEVIVQTMADPRTQFTKYLAECKSQPVPLAAIGNEAASCSARHAGLAIGRVRDHAFIIRTITNDHSVTSEALEEKAQVAARHVAGNLF